MDVCRECCALSGRGLGDGLITRPEESYWLWCVVVCDPRNLENEEAKACYRAVENTARWVVTPGKQTNWYIRRDLSVFLSLTSLCLLIIGVECSCAPDDTHTLPFSLSVGLLWKRDRPIAEAATWQHTTLTTKRYPCLLWDSNTQSQ
jgi:hypothetical protein